MIFDSRQTPGDVQAVYMEAAGAADRPASGIAIFSERSVAQGMAEWPVVPDHLRLYARSSPSTGCCDDRDERMPVSSVRG